LTNRDKPVTVEHEQLLHAALSNGQDAIDAWRQWRATFDFELSGPRYLPLLPLVYHNLAKFGVDEPLGGKLRGLHRRAWYTNQLRLTWVGEQLETWRKLDIDAICLPDISLPVDHYADAGLRPVRLRFLVPTSRARDAITALEADGWQLEPAQLPPEFVDAHHVCRFVHERHERLALYWALFPPRLNVERDGRFWTDRQPFACQAVASYSLSDTDQLLFLCSEGRNGIRLPLWVADAVTLLQHPTVTIDWDRFATNCQGEELSRVVLSSLTYLRSEFGAPIPSEVLEAIASRLTVANERQPLIRRLGRRTMQVFRHGS